VRPDGEQEKNDIFVATLTKCLTREDGKYQSFWSNQE